VQVLLPVVPEEEEERAMLEVIMKDLERSVSIRPNRLAVSQSRFKLTLSLSFRLSRTSSIHLKLPLKVLIVLQQAKEASFDRVKPLNPTSSPLPLEHPLSLPLTPTTITAIPSARTSLLLARCLSPFLSERRRLLPVRQPWTRGVSTR